MPNEKELLRIDEAREILPVSRSVLYGLIEEGKLVTARPNGPKKKPIFVFRWSLMAYIKSITNNPNQAEEMIGRRIISRGIIEA